MAKKKNQVQPFGSRKGIDGAVIRGSTVSIKNNSGVWFSDMTVMIDEAAALVASAQIVTSYYREHGSKLGPVKSAIANESMGVLTNVIQSHQQSVAALRKRLAEMREKNPGTKLTTALSISMMDLAMDIEGLMNDFSNVGFYAIDNALEPYRVLATEDESVVMPLYMAPKTPDQKSYASLKEGAPVKTMTVVGMPGELLEDVDPTKPAQDNIRELGETVGPETTISMQAEVVVDSEHKGE